MSVKVLIATHKDYIFPDDIIYHPILVGKSLSSLSWNYLSDDDDINISEKNKSFCELTALYWAWKNDFFKDVEYCGLVHYRRYFKGGLVFGKNTILDKSEINKILNDCDLIVPKKRNYYIESVEKHYKNAHYKDDLDAIKLIIKEMTPEYIDAFDSIMTQKKLHLYNMFIMRKEFFYDYCSWLFPLLFKLEMQIDISNYSNYQRRVYGFLAERLFNVWVLHHKLNFKEIVTENIEEENLMHKAFGLLKRKMNKKYKN